MLSFRTSVLQGREHVRASESQANHHETIHISAGGFSVSNGGFSVSALKGLYMHINIL